jgi:CRP-like cAMP-binding protein
MSLKILPHNESLQLQASTLSRFKIFEDFNERPEVLEEFNKVMTLQEFAPNALIIKEGDTGTAMFFLLSGKVGVYRNTPAGDEFMVAELLSQMNVIFGEGALVDDDTRSATIKALTKVECLVLDRFGFDEFARKNPEWALPVFRRIARAVMGRLRKTNSDFLLLYNALVAEIKGS